MKNTHIITNALKEPSTGVTSTLNTKDPYHSDTIYPGDSVDEHKKLESANHLLTLDEVRQQNENL